jgi:hypothetical protein
MPVLGVLGDEIRPSGALRGRLVARAWRGDASPLVDSVTDPMIGQNRNLR